MPPPRVTKRLAAAARLHHYVQATFVHQPQHEPAPAVEADIVLTRTRVSNGLNRRCWPTEKHFRFAPQSRLLK
jgi:hypothetical protein